MQLGEATVENITRKLPNWQLELTNLCGRAYDGANAGATKGAAAHILQQYSKALFTLCADHMLNLCMVKCFSVLKVSNATELPDSSVCFFDNLPKRQNFSFWSILEVKWRKGESYFFCFAFILKVGVVDLIAISLCLAITYLSNQVFPQKNLKFLLSALNNWCLLISKFLFSHYWSVLLSFNFSFLPPDF